MSGEPLLTVVGNLGGDPELRFTPSGKAVANFTVASTPRVKDGDAWKDGTPTWFACSVWDAMAENVAESLTRGDRVVVQGYLTTREYETRDGGKGKSLDLRVEAVGPDLRWATAKVTRATRSGSSQPAAAGGQQQQARPQQAAQPQDPWGTPAGPTSDEPPF